MPVVAAMTVWIWLFDRRRGAINYLLDMMGAEIAIGHSYVRGGDMPDVPLSPGGVLGAVRGTFHRQAEQGCPLSGPVTNSALLISQPFIPPEGWRGKRETVSETRGPFGPKTLRRGWMSRQDA